MATTVLPGADYPSPSHIFVGRTQLIASMLQLPVSDRAQIADACAVVGGGKTKLLDRVRSELSSNLSTLVLKIELAESDAQLAQVDPSQALITAFARFREIVLALVDQSVEYDRKLGGNWKSTQRAFEPVSRAVQVGASRTSPMNITINNKPSVGPFANVSSNLGTSVNIALGKGAMDQVVLGSEEDIAKTFAEAFQDVIKNRNAVVTIDGFEWAAPTVLGGWLLDLVRRLALTLAVVARTPEVQIPAQPRSDLFPCPLGPLTPDEIRELLEKSLPGQPIEQSLVDVVTEFSSGHPHTAGLSAELLQRLSPAEREASALERRLAALPSDLAKRHSDLVDAIIEHDPPVIAQAVRACSVLRRFDSGLLEALLPGQDGKGGELIEQLNQYTFIDPVDDPRGGFFQMHEFIRAELDRKLAANDPAAYAKLQSAAAAHISAWLNDFEEAGSDEAAFESVRRKYGGWYRYERPDWKAAVREWLYHQARAASGPDADKERQLGRLRFARIVLDAFWWWGCYVDFPFIRDLLNDWKDSQADQEWAADLEKFVANYPTGYRKDPDAERWDRVFQAVLSVRTACGLAGLPDALDEQHLHVRGLIDLFMAHSNRYRAPDAGHTAASLYAAARKHYDEALAIFAQNGDDWDLAWTYFESSDLETEKGGQLAQPHWKLAVGLLASKGLGDDELAANLYRVAADASWSSQPLKALADHGSAIWHAYLFQGRYQGARYRPDAYTLMYYAEQIERSSSRLFEYAQKGGEAATALAQLRARLPNCPSVGSDQLKAWCAGGDAGHVAGLFLPPPPLDQLTLTTSPFLVEWEANLEAAGEPVAIVDESAW